ncbi:MAG: cytochrome c3 family protein [Verrucomicrobiae bacterium]|nr:cytochrome c3 family protein [Verrucomicrobiae bacterium]
MWKKAWPWFVWVVLTLSMSSYFTLRMKGPDATVFLPGATTHGHHQIEVRCEVCHDPLNGVKEQACYDCHAADLKAVNDSHPKSKFTDPRNADRVRALDARKCVTCHREHVPDQTRPMGVTLPDDFCAHCHQETLENRESHAGLPFDSCATAGCHNFHDNTALYENFLSRHLDEPNHKEHGSVLPRGLAAYFETAGIGASSPVRLEERDAPPSKRSDAAINTEWVETSHAGGGVNCGDCHHETKDERGGLEWIEKPGLASCARCHQSEASTFLAGKHGMRLAQDLEPMRPDMARLPMKHEAGHRELNCTSCHPSHRFDTRYAAVEACLSCHADEHSLAYKRSSHFALWQDETAGRLPSGSGVSCATCHMPRIEHKDVTGTRTLVTHNQSFNLQPNEKMIRTACLPCHGLGYVIDALADVQLIKTNFRGEPSRHIESLDWVRRRISEKQR